MKNYFTYLPETPLAAMWGCAATSAGFTRIPAGAPYPPHRHPGDHHFNWKRGRILESYQLVLISEGSGLLEMGAIRQKWPLSAGSLFVLFPGVWHRYAPDSKTGWVEHWIELRGPALERACDCGLIRADRPVFDTAAETALHEAFSRIHAWAHENAIAHQNLLSTLGLHLLALLGCRSSDDRDTLGHIVQRAQTLLTDSGDRCLSMPDIARELKVGYSHFRQIFKARTGMSPKRFHQVTRIRRAKELIANTDKSLDEIADLLGFSSAFHLSRQFKEVTGVAPRHWREGLLAPDLHSLDL